MVVFVTGDIPKALAAGADCHVRIASSRNQESPGETIIFEGRKFKSYRGMGSVEPWKLVLKTVISRC
jgi:IMP dehydrogenase